MPHGRPRNAPVPTLDPLALPQIVTAVPGPQSQQWLQRLALCESPNVTAMGPDFPIVWQRARGPVVQDVDGNLLLDLGSSFGVALVGHNHPSVVAAVHAQADQLLHGMGDVHPPAVRIALLERLQHLAPGDLGRAVLCGGGSEAVEVAQKTALLATGKPGIIAFAGSYHGLGHGALSATSRRDFREPFSAHLSHHVAWVPFPQALHPPPGVAPDRVAEHVLGRVADLIDHPAQGGMPIGAVLFEPIQGRGGSVLPPEGFLGELARVCRSRGVLLIADEIFTGLGRTGQWWAGGEAVPDLLCVGKALGGGMPIAACLGRPEVMAAWGPSRGEALHTSTFLGHPVAAAAALATLQVLEDEDIPRQASEQGALWLAELTAALQGLPGVLQVRGAGLMLGIELADQPGQSAGARVWQWVLNALRHGLIVLPAGARGEVLQLTPPACVSPEQRRFAVAGLRAALVASQGLP